MVNSSEFADRLQKIIEFYGETASSFSDNIGVQRSSISHILSGRNKPSLDFVLKILSRYPEVELYWLLNGKGHFPSLSQESATSLKPDATSPEASNKTSSEPSEKTIDKIVVFYTDGTFKEFIKH